MYFLVLFLYYFVPAQIMLYLYYSCINIEKAAGQKDGLQLGAGKRRQARYGNNALICRQEGQRRNRAGWIKY